MRQKAHRECTTDLSKDDLAFTPNMIPKMLKLIHKTTIKLCELDPLLARLLKTNIEHITPAITDIVNTSLTSGKVITNLKTVYPTATPKDVKPVNWY